MLLSSAGDAAAPAGERSITLQIFPAEGLGGGWARGSSFGADVFFSSKSSSNPYSKTEPDVEMIVMARVDRAR
jgi:hypothetical protein